MGTFAMMTSRFALLAAAGLLVGGLSAGQASAADLGGNCCADLEERIADLEATTVRKGNRKVSLTLSGQVNRALLWYDDGSMTGVRSVDNNNSSTRFRLQGDAKIGGGWSMGYYLETEFITSNSFGTDQIESRRAINGVTSTTTGALANGEGNSPLTLGLRQSHWYIKNDQLGTVSVGRVNTASKDLITTELGGIGVVAYADTREVGSEFLLRRQGTTDRAGLCATGLGCTSTLRWNNFIPTLDSYRFDGVRYDSPTWYGFTSSSSFGDDYRYDTALRFAKEFNGIQFAAGISYTVDQDENVINNDNTATPAFTLKPGSKDQRDTRVVASVLHVPTGLFATGFYLNREFRGRGVGSPDVVAGTNGLVNKPDFDYYYVASGITRNWFGIGNTAFYGEYGHGQDALVGNALNFTTNQAVLAPGGLNFAQITKSDIDVWGIGAVQNINSAATELYIGYRHFSSDVAGVTAIGGPSTKQNFDDLHVVMSGARIKF